MSNTIAVVKGISVQQDPDGRVFWTSGAAIDADGSNGQNGKGFAYQANDKGLDALASAGYIKSKANGGGPNSWGTVLIDRGDGTPLDDGGGVNWYSSTTYAWKGRPVPTRYVDATTVPYVVVNPHVRKNAVGIVIGCRARITYKGTTIDAVVADVSRPQDIGELSIAAAVALGFTKAQTSPRTGGVGSGVTFEFWPGQAAHLLGEVYELQAAG
jgi:hypothetical protein